MFAKRDVGTLGLAVGQGMDHATSVSHLLVHGYMNSQRKRKLSN